MDYELGSHSVDLRSCVLGGTILIAAFGSCVEKKASKAMTDNRRNWGELTGGCRVSIALLPGPQEDRFLVTLDIVFRNESSAVVQFPRSSLWFDYDYAVLSQSGAEVPLTAFGKQQRDNLRTAAAAVRELAPGAEYRSSVELSRLYEFDRPGSYSIQASKTFRDPSSGQFVTAVSNRLDLRLGAAGNRQ